MQSNEIRDREKPQKRTTSLGIPNVDKKQLELIKDAIKDEMTDYEYYGRLIAMTDNTPDKSMLRRIRLDELKHEKLLRVIYQELTGETVTVEYEPKAITGSVRNEYEKSVLDELEAADYYKKMYLSFANPEIRDMLFDILTDEQSHAIAFTFLSDRRIY